MNKKNPEILFYVISFIPILIWLICRWGTPMFSDYDTITHSLGQLSGLVGMTMFALTFILTTKLKFIENYMQGLDKMYKLHHKLGIYSFILVLFHPILLVLNFIPANFNLAMKYLLPSSNWPINFGILALLALIALIVLTIFAKITYQNWKISHKLMGIVFLIACFHVFLVTTDITFYPILKYYMLAVSIIGLIAYAYASFIRYAVLEHYKYKLVKTKSIGGGITLLELAPIKNQIQFEPGQFIFIKFLDSQLGTESHPFTIASNPEQKNITLAIKSLGDYTSKLNSLKPGAIAEISGPHGKFNLIDNKDQIWIAGGIGITPFLSLSQHILHNKNFKNKIDLYYCTKNREESPFLEMLNEIASKSSGRLRIIPFHSQEKGRLQVETIIRTSKEINNKSFLLCGPNEMMHSLANKLKENGIKDIHFEDFNLK